VEGSSATGIDMGSVIAVLNSYEISTFSLRLKEKKRNIEISRTN